MLNDEDKYRIRQEELFREEVRRELTQPKNLGKKIWIILNKPFTLYFISAILIAGSVQVYSFWQESQQKLEANIELRAGSFKNLSTVISLYTEALTIIYRDTMSYAIDADSLVLFKVGSSFQKDELYAIIIEHDELLMERAELFQLSLNTMKILSSYIMDLSIISRNRFVNNKNTMISLEFPSFDSIMIGNIEIDELFSTEPKLEIDKNIPLALAAELEKNGHEVMKNLEIQVEMFKLIKQNISTDKLALSMNQRMKFIDNFLSGLKTLPESVLQLRRDAIINLIGISNLEVLNETIKHIQKSFVNLCNGELYDPNLINIKANIEKLLLKLDNSSKYAMEIYN